MDAPLTSSEGYQTILERLNDEFFFRQSSHRRSKPNRRLPAPMVHHEVARLPRCRGRLVHNQLVQPHDAQKPGHAIEETSWPSISWISLSLARAISKTESSGNRVVLIVDAEQ